MVCDWCKGRVKEPTIVVEPTWRAHLCARCWRQYDKGKKPARRRARRG